MTDLATQIVTALFDQATLDGGLIKDRALEKVRELVAAHDWEQNCRERGDRVERQLKKLGFWQDDTPDDECFKGSEATFKRKELSDYARTNETTGMINFIPAGNAYMTATEVMQREADAKASVVKEAFGL